MTISLSFMFIMMAVVVWWLFQQVFAKPWATEGAIEDVHAGATTAIPAAKAGFWVFIAVITSMFCLFASAYFMRMYQLNDWVPVTEPDILWFNTGLLILASAAMQWINNAAARGQHLHRIKTGMIIGGVFSFAFLFGQVAAWYQLNNAGYLLSSNPANAFFYLLTALHGIHLLGGLWVWGKTAAKLFTGTELNAVRLSIELCTSYWHYLLLVWLAFFTLLLST